jgi:SPP1 gp7 family putative phage head morphogenesis protein
MLHNHKHRHGIKKNATPLQNRSYIANAKRNKYDPTGTLSIQRSFVLQINKIFRNLRKQIDERVSLLLSQLQSPLKRNEGYDFPLTQADINGFMDWLEKQEDKGVLNKHTRTGIHSSPVSEAWSNVYIESAYKKGIQTAYSTMEQEAKRSKKEWTTRDIKGMFFEPIHAELVGRLYARTFTNLKNITNEMNTGIKETLAKGVADGLGANALTIRLHKQVNMTHKRAHTIARTETVRAMNEAQLSTYESFGVYEVSVIVEWHTAGDDRVCGYCESRHGGTYSIKDARGLLPAHPNCRCAWIPAESTFHEKTPEKHIEEAKPVKRSEVESDILDPQKRIGNVDVYDEYIEGIEKIRKDVTRNEEEHLKGIDKLKNIMAGQCQQPLSTKEKSEVAKKIGAQRDRTMQYLHKEVDEYLKSKASFRAKDVFQAGAKDTFTPETMEMTPKKDYILRAVRMEEKYGRKIEDRLNAYLDSHIKNNETLRTLERKESHIYTGLMDKKNLTPKEQEFMNRMEIPYRQNTAPDGCLYKTNQDNLWKAISVQRENEIMTKVHFNRDGILPEKKDIIYSSVEGVHKRLDGVIPRNGTKEFVFNIYENTMTDSKGRKMTSSHYNANNGECYINAENSSFRTGGVRDTIRHEYCHRTGRSEKIDSKTEMALSDIANSDILEKTGVFKDKLFIRTDLQSPYWLDVNKLYENKREPIITQSLKGYTGRVYNQPSSEYFPVSFSEIDSMYGDIFYKTVDRRDKDGVLHIDVVPNYAEIQKSREYFVQKTKWNMIDIIAEEERNKKQKGK